MLHTEYTLIEANSLKDVIKAIQDDDYEYDYSERIGPFEQGEYKAFVQKVDPDDFEAEEEYCSLIRYELYENVEP